MNHRKAVERTKYYHQEAFACAAAALRAPNLEVRQAYLELEQAWLCLVPKSKEGRDGWSEAEPGDSRGATDSMLNAHGAAGADRGRIDAKDGDAQA